MWQVYGKTSLQQKYRGCLQYVDDVRNQCSQNYVGVGAYWHKDELTAVLAKSDFPSDVQAALRDMAEFFNFTL